MENEERLWYILYTKPQQEIKVAERLEKIGLQAYCPYKVEVKQWSDRKKYSKTPLLKSYVFVRLKSHERAKIFEVPGVIRYLFWLGKPAIALDKEIEVLKKSLELPYTSISVENLVSGKRMLITSGPFKDEEGTIVKVNKKHVTVALIQLGFLVTLEY